jgi:AcrR family transcriptional regulator
MCDAGSMAQIVCPLVSAEDRARLEAIIGDRNRAQKHVARARIILGSAARLSVAEVARRAGVGRPAVWRRQRRFAEAGVDGLLRDATVRRVVGLTCSEPPGEATHWTGRAMAKTAAISLRSMQRIWASHGLQPLREMIAFAAEQLMELEVQALTGADYGERSPERLAQGNSYRKRDWATRAETVELRIPKLRKVATSQALLEPRRGAEKALTAVIQEAYVQGISSRSVDELVKALGMGRAHLPRAADRRAIGPTSGSTRLESRCAKPGASSRRSAALIFSTSWQRAILSSVIVVVCGQWFLVVTRPYRRSRDDHPLWTAGLATPDSWRSHRQAIYPQLLHDLQGRDRKAPDGGTQVRQPNSPLAPN